MYSTGNENAEGVNVKNLRIFEKVLSTYKRTLRAVILSKPSRDCKTPNEILRLRTSSYAQDDTREGAPKNLCVKNN